MRGTSCHRRRVIESGGIYVELALGRWGNAMCRWCGAVMVLVWETEN